MPLLSSVTFFRIWDSIVSKMLHRPISSGEPELIDQRLYALLAAEISEFAIFLIDEAGQIASWNRGVERVLQYSKHEFVGKPFIAIFTPEDKTTGQPEEELRTAFHTGVSTDIRWHVRKDGSQFWCDGFLYALRDDDGRFLGYAKVLRDATARKRVETDLLQNQERLEAALSASATGTFHWEVVTDKLVYDENFRSLLALPAGDELRDMKTLISTVHEEDRDATHHAFLSAHEGSHFEAEFRIVQPRGGVRWLHAKGKLCAGGAGFSLYMPGAVMDITARKEAEAERERILIESARRAAELNAILASMPEGVYFGDETGINECNERGLRMLGLQGKTDLKHPVSELMRTIQTRFPDTDEPIPYERQPFIRALHGETVVEEVAVRRVDTGEEVILRSAAAPVLLDGAVVGAVALNTDITHEKQVELERERLLAALWSSNEELSQFAYVVSHDLQAPLRAITSFTQLLKRRHSAQLGEDAQLIISSILEGTQNMNQLISAVLQYARAGQQSPALQPIALSGVIEGVLLTLSPEITATGATVKCLTEMPVVETDWVQISQVFQNLVSNALTYRKQDVVPRIEISSMVEEAECVVTVADNGIGIESTYFEKIFEPLKRLHGRELPGTGIGLAICRKIIQRFGGRIWVESELGVGSKFIFTLPL